MDHLIWQKFNLKSTAPWISEQLKISIFVKKGKICSRFFLPAPRSNTRIGLIWVAAAASQSIHYLDKIQYDAPLLHDRRRKADFS